MGKKNAKKRRNPLLRPAVYLVEHLHIGSGKGDRGLNREIQELASGDQKAIGKYHVKNTATALAVLLVMLLITASAALISSLSEQDGREERILRGTYGAGRKEEELLATVDGEGESELISALVSERVYSRAEVRKHLEQALEQVQSTFLGENETPDEVRSDLVFEEEYCGGLVKGELITIPYGMVDEHGQIAGEPDEAGSIIELQLTLSMQDEQLLWESSVMVYPPLLTEREQFWTDVRKALEEADKESRDLPYLDLPEEVDGKKISWSRETVNVVAVLLLLAVSFPLLVRLKNDSAVHESVKARRQMLRIDYSELLWKMTMLLGAGMTIRGTFERIAEEAEQIRPLQQEMKRTILEMNSGVSEAEAYENFGRRCNLPEYIELGSVLARNLKKGSGGLAAQLEKEAVTASQARRDLARSLSEKAGTKLLFPMIMMFGVVLAVLIMPAFLSM